MRIVGVALLCCVTVACWDVRSRPAPPCQVEIEATELDFGALPVGSRAGREVLVTNVSNGFCELSAELVEGSSGAFAVFNSFYSYLGPMDTFGILVEYAPTQATEGETATLRIGATNAYRGEDAPDIDVLLLGQGTPAQACYADSECEVGRCTREEVIAPVFQWSDPSDVEWAPADVTSGFASVYNNHVEIRLQFREAPFDPARSQSLRICIDSDEDWTTGTACGEGSLKGADTVIEIKDGELVEAGPIDDPCLSGSYEAASKTLRLHFERYAFPTGGFEQPFRYVVLSSYVDEQGETVTDRAPAKLHFQRSREHFESRAWMALWPSAAKCCRFRAGECVGGTCLVGR